MDIQKQPSLQSKLYSTSILSVIFTFALIFPAIVSPSLAADAPVPLLKAGQPADWWFVFKFGSKDPFAGCGPNSGTRSCPFGGKVQTYKIGQQYVYASSLDGKLTKGKVCVGATESDPVGATFDQVYNGSFYHVIWNDQFYGDPKLKICGSGNCTGSWGHSKGMLAWNNEGQGFVMQVTTPSWPGSGRKTTPRKSGNTLGCISTNNNVAFSQHFFALKVTKDDLLVILKALGNASVVTDPGNSQIVRNGGPADVQALVDKLGKKSSNTTYTKDELSSGVILISKPSKLNVPPWQMVSSLLKGEELLTATWWADPRIYSTNATSKIKCWADKLTKPGSVKIAITGNWNGEEVGLKGGQNHAKFGVTKSGDLHYVVFGDENQQGTIAPPDCDSSQNGRGGLFFAVQDEALYESVGDLLKGDVAPAKAPTK